MTIATSTSTDGINGVTAQITCPSFELTSFNAQAVQPTSGSTSYTSSAITSVSGSSDNDREGPLGALHATYADLDYHDNKEDVTALAFEVEGPEEVISKDDFRIQTHSGDRKIVKKNGKYYLATADGAEPESLLFVSNIDTPAGKEGDIPPPKHEDEPRQDGNAAFIKGFAAGALGGGGALVTGTWDVLVMVATLPAKAQDTGVDLLLSWVSEDAAQRSKQRIEEAAANAETVGEATTAVAKLLVKIESDKLALYRAIFNRDIGEQERILGEYAIYADIGSEFFNELIDDHEALDDYHKGVCAGRIFFEVALIVLPMTKAAQVGNAAGSVSKVSAMERIANNINASKWLEKFPLNMKGPINRLVAKVLFITQEMRKTQWLQKGSYGRDGERIWTLKWHYQKRGGKTPLEAIRSVEKNHQNLNPKAWAAAALDALVEESKLAHLVRADGARIIKLDPPANRTMFWSGLGRGGSDKAKVIAEAKGLKTLEAQMDTKGVSNVFNDGERLGYKWKDEFRIAVWDGVSEQFAKEASGKIYVALGEGVTETSVWSRVEFPALIKNKNVQEIWRVDPITLQETLLWSK